jgi:glycogen operon protein
MLLAGDEMGRTQQGNNNAYCQDNVTSWVDWSIDDDARALLAFTARVIALRKRHPLFQRRTFFLGRATDAVQKDIVWLNPDGGEMTDEQWGQSSSSSFGAALSGQGVTERDEHGHPVVDDDLMLLFNAHHEAVAFKLPDGGGPPWAALLDTSSDDGAPLAGEHPPGSSYSLQARSLALLGRPRA